jgi:predicted transcriptional regulator
MVKISLELPDELAAALERAAAEMQSTREAVLVDAARDFLAERDPFAAFADDEEALETFIAEGEADVAAGRVIPAEEVFAELDAIVAAALARQRG